MFGLKNVIEDTEYDDCFHKTAACTFSGFGDLGFGEIEGHLL